MRGKEEGNTNLQVRAERQILQSAGLLWAPKPARAPRLAQGARDDADFLPYLRLMYVSHPKEPVPLFSPQFLQIGKERYLSCGGSEVRYAWYKMTKKSENTSVLGKFGNIPHRWQVRTPAESPAGQFGHFPFPGGKARDSFENRSCPEGNPNITRNKQDTRKGEEHGVGSAGISFLPFCGLSFFACFVVCLSSEAARARLRRTAFAPWPCCFQANGMNSVLRSTYARHAMFGPRGNNHGFGSHAAFGAVKTGRFLPGESARTPRIGPARCGPRISMLCRKVMYPFSLRKMGRW